MARQSKAQRAAEMQARAAEDNNAAALLQPGTHYESDLLGVVVLGERLPKGTGDDEYWDMYDVIFSEMIQGVLHKNVHHTWSSALVRAAFKS